ncbi:MAG: carboxymuconolactone decarboxylase family protein [Actinomycetota bacterium]|nr:carboxymuconolactone decarboxylase family protein [Actinomycetota bacterium]
MSESNQMNEPAASASTAIPFAPLPDHVAARVRQASVKQVNLYRALAHAPRLLEAWIDFSWLLREHCETPRALRELIILRTAQLTLSQYEWHQHRRMAAEAGVEEYQVAELAMWRTSPAFIDAERAALALTDALADGHVPDEVNAALTEHFGPQARVELTLTASFYFGVPRLLDALRVPVEVAPTPPADSDRSGQAHEPS